MALGQGAGFVGRHNIVRNGGDTGRLVGGRTQRSERIKLRHGAQIMTRRSCMLRLFLSAMVIAVVGGGSAAAQSVTGSIQGTVVDQSGGVLPGVTVTVTNTSTGVSRSIVTDDTGTFRAELLPVGVYDVTAELQGFTTPKAANVTLTVGATLTLRFEMRVAGLAETVMVSGAAPVIETTRSQV